MHDEAVELRGDGDVGFAAIHVGGFAAEGIGQRRAVEALEDVRA
jgi:hypothetical protein